MQEITLYADRGNAEAIGDMLMEAGASSYTTQDADADTPSESPLFGEPGLEPKVQAWNRSLLTVLADDGFDWKTSLAVIEKALGIEKLEVKSVEAVPTGSASRRLSFSRSRPRAGSGLCPPGPNRRPLTRSI
jgi:ribosomal protein L11 methyltransferase